MKSQIQMQKIEAGELQIGSIFEWNGRLFVVKSAPDKDYRFEAENIASGWTNNGMPLPNVWREAMGTTTFDGYSHVLALVYVERPL